MRATITEVAENGQSAAGDDGGSAQGDEDIDMDGNTDAGADEHEDGVASDDTGSEVSPESGGEESEESELTEPSSEIEYVPANGGTGPNGASKKRKRKPRQRYSPSASPARQPTVTRSQRATRKSGISSTSKRPESDRRELKRFKPGHYIDPESGPPPEKLFDASEKYVCPVGNCGRRFYHRTELITHEKRRG